MTARLLVLFETPADPDSFDWHYRETHIPLARRLPGLRSYTISRDTTTIRGGEPYYLVIEADWDTMDELRAAFASPEGRATAEDAARLQRLTSMRSMIFTVEDLRPGREPAASRPIGVGDPRT